MVVLFFYHLFSLVFVLFSFCCCGCFVFLSSFLFCFCCCCCCKQAIGACKQAVVWVFMWGRMIVGDAIVVVVFLFSLLLLLFFLFSVVFCFSFCCCFYCCFCCCWHKSDVGGGGYAKITNSFDFQAKAAEGIDSCKERTKCGGAKDPVCFFILWKNNSLMRSDFFLSRQKQRNSWRCWRHWRSPF